MQWCSAASPITSTMCANIAHSRRRNIVQIIVTIKTYGRNKFLPLRRQPGRRKKNCWNGYAELKLWARNGNKRHQNSEMKEIQPTAVKLLQSRARARKAFQLKAGEKTCEWWFPLQYGKEGRSWDGAVIAGQLRCVVSGDQSRVGSFISWNWFGIANNFESILNILGDSWLGRKAFSSDFEIKFLRIHEPILRIEKISRQSLVP